MLVLFDKISGVENAYERIVSDPALVMKVLVGVAEECGRRIGPPRNGRLTPHEFAEIVVRVTGLRSRRSIYPLVALARAMVKMDLLEAIIIPVRLRNDREVLYTVTRLGTMLAELSCLPAKFDAATGEVRKLLDRHLPQYNSAVRRSGPS